MKGHLSVGYIDDSYLQAAEFAHCVHNITDTIKLFNDLGFVIHPDKSVLYPTQRLVFLGFVLDSIVMTLYTSHLRKLVMLRMDVSGCCCPLVL